MSLQDERISHLEGLIKTEFGYGKINKGRERLNIFYTEKRKMYELNKASLEVMTDQDILKILRKENEQSK